jgi:hypothetical protein
VGEEPKFIMSRFKRESRRKIGLEPLLEGEMPWMKE